MNDIIEKIEELKQMVLDKQDNSIKIIYKIPMAWGWEDTEELINIDLPITQIDELDKRTKNCLLNEGILSIADLLKNNQVNNMLKVPNFGKESYSLLTGFLKKHNLKYEYEDVWNQATEDYKQKIISEIQNEMLKEYRNAYKNKIK